MSRAAASPDRTARRSPPCPPAAQAAADKDRREWSWMTVHHYVPDRPVKYAFKDIKSLEAR